jgi:uncharacterized membrane protein YeaQ/YmgE (transglycosylase-associated protein family)/osmotically-inducible protein OsmY
MSLILFLVFGLFVGALARLIVPGREPGGWAVSMLIGVIGSFVGGFLGRGLGMYQEGEPAGFLMSLLGAILLVGGYHAFTSRRVLALEKRIPLMTRLVYLTAALLVVSGCANQKPAESLPPDTTTTTVTQSPDMNSGTSSSTAPGSTMPGSSGSSMSGTGSSTGVTSTTTPRTSSGTGSSGTATTGSSTTPGPAGAMTPTAGTAQATAPTPMPPPGPNADNTAMNKKDRDNSNLTPMDQGGSEADRKVTQKIRQALMGDKNLSFTAKNVKVITINGKVTLRGAVKTDQERSSIESAAKAVAGDAQVDNQIEVKK